jgi:hypothetical protein
LIVNWVTRSTRGHERFNKHVNVVAHKVEVVRAVSFVRRGVHSNLDRWQPEDKPTAANVDIGQSDNVAQEGPLSFRARTVDDGICATDRDAPLPI